MEMRQLILRSNRFLGSALVDRGLIEQASLEQANEQLIDLIQTQEVHRPCLLQILVYDLKVLEEEALLESLAKGAPVGMIDLRSVAIRLPAGTDPSECGATGTVPFDYREGMHFVATTYYYSKPVRDFWEEKLDGSISWFVTTVAGMNEALEDLTGEPAPETRSPIPIKEESTTSP